MTPTIIGVHHLKFAVADLDRSLHWYERALTARRLAELDHRRPDGEVFAYILEVPGLGTFLELRRNLGQAAAQRGFDPVTFAVQQRTDLDTWAAHFDHQSLDRSPVLAGVVGWALVVEDPDGRRLRFYTLETHGPEIQPDLDERWLGAL